MTTAPASAGARCPLRRDLLTGRQKTMSVPSKRAGRSTRHASSGRRTGLIPDERTDGVRLQRSERETPLLERGHDLDATRPVAPTTATEYACFVIGRALPCVMRKT